MRLGVLTGGGDCAGINAVIRGVVRRANVYGYDVTGIKRGWAGLLEPDTIDLTYDKVADIVSLGGTILLTSRTNPFARKDGPLVVMENLKKLGIDCLVAIGGDDTLGVASKLGEHGAKAVGIPKTMDNDLSSTDYTFGFDSAVNVAVEAIDRIRTTGESHERIMVVEVFGRDVGWVATHAGIASGAHEILVPEKPFDFDEVAERLMARIKNGKKFSLVVVAEGAHPIDSKKSQGMAVDEFGHAKLGGVGQFVAKEIEKRVGVETREVTIGHVMRGGPPSAFDRVLGTRLGVAAVDLVKGGKFGMMPALRGTQIVSVDMKEALAQKLLDPELLSVGRIFS